MKIPYWAPADIMLQKRQLHHFYPLAIVWMTNICLNDNCQFFLFHLVSIPCPVHCHLTHSGSFRAPYLFSSLSTPAEPPALEVTCLFINYKNCFHLSMCFTSTQVMMNIQYEDLNGFTEFLTSHNWHCLCSEAILKEQHLTAPSHHRWKQQIYAKVGSNAKERC